MNRLHRHPALVLGGLGLLALLFWPRDSHRSSAPSRRDPAPATAVPASAARSDRPAAPSLPNRALSKTAQQKVARIAAPITTAPAAVGGDSRFVLRDRTVSAFFTPRGVSLALPWASGGERSGPAERGWGLHWGIAGAREVEPRAEDEQAAKVNVLKGPPEEWQVGQKSFGRVAYDDVKPGVRMTVESASHGVKYSLSAAKASDIAALRLRYRGAAALRAAADGKSLEILAGAGQLREDGLIVTQEGRPIEASYRITGQDEYAIVLHGAEPDAPVEVDPLIGWSTYLGGTLSSGGGSEYGFSVKVDGGGNMYVAGQTTSGDFPNVAGNLDESMGGTQDGFVLKLNSAGAVVWATYLGGSSFDEIRSLALDSASNVYVTGYTQSTDFPLAGTVVDTLFSGPEAFAARINASGTALSWSTFLGGASSDFGQSIAVDGTGTIVWVAGITYSTDFPTFAGFDSNASTPPEGFVTRLNIAYGAPNVVTFGYSSYVGGSGDDSIYAMAVDASGAAYLTGYTSSFDLPLAGTPFQAFNGGVTDVFVVKVKPSATALEWGTYIGGSDEDVAYDIFVDGSGSAYITGYSYSFDYPTNTSSNYNSGNSDVILTKLNPSGSALMHSSYLGGTDSDTGLAVVVDAAGQAYVTGYSYSSDFSFPIGTIGSPFPSPYDTTHSGLSDIFVTAFAANPSGGFPLLWSSWLGGTGYDFPYSIAINNATNDLYLTGDTTSLPVAGPEAFPLSSAPNPPPFDGTLGGSRDAYIIRLSISGPTVALTYGSYVGGASQVGDDFGRKVAFDAAGNIYVAGITSSQNFPTTSGVFQPGPNVLNDCTVTKYSNAASPALLWSTYLGGNSSDEPSGIAVDPRAGATANQVYVSGHTFSTNFPTTVGPAPAGSWDVFITKLLVDGNGLAWSRRLGGSSSDFARALAVGANGDAAVCGNTASTNYTVTVSAYQAALSGSNDAFGSLVSADGATVLWSSYLGGTLFDQAQGVAFNAAGNRLFMGGYTTSSNFPVTGGVQQPALAGSNDYWVCRVNPGALGVLQLEMSTYYGGTGSDIAADIAVDPSDNVYIAGDTNSSLFPITTGPAFAGGFEGALAKFNSSGIRQWARFLGGSGTDRPRQIRVDANGSAYVVGQTFSINFPVQSAIQGFLAGSSDVFVTKIDASGSSLDWSTYIGGTSSENPLGLSLGAGGAVVVVGETNSPDFPRVNPLDNSLNGWEYFITRIDNSNPSNPTSLAQFKTAAGGGASIGVGSWSNEASFVAKATLGDLDDDNVALEVEVRPINVAFSNVATATGVLGPGGPLKEVTAAFPAGTQEFHWQARTIDVHGRTSNWVSFGGNSDGAPPTTNAARDLGRDISAPSLTLTSPTAPHTTATSPISLIGTFADTGGSGVSSVSWLNLSVPAPPPVNSGGATLNSPAAGQWTIPSISLVPGVNNISLSVTDAAGNTSFIAGNPISVTYDTTAPSSTVISTPSPSPYLTGTGTAPTLPPTGTITLSGNSTDDFSVSSVTWTNGATGGNGTATFVAGGTPPTNRFWQALNVPVAPGANTITVRTFDGANNVNSSQVVVNYDNQPPAVGVTSHVSGFTTSAASITLVGTASDQAAPYSNSISAVSTSNNGGASQAASVGVPAAGQWTSAAISLVGGANVITVTASDGVVNARSNLNAASTSITIHQDVQNPVIAIGSPTPPTFTTGTNSVTVSGTATDDQNVVSVTYTNSLVPGPPQPVFNVTPLLGPVTNRTWSTNVSLSLGTNTLLFTVTDIVGRTGTATIDILYDDTVPSLLVSNPASTTAVVSSTPFAGFAGTATASGMKTITAVTLRNVTTNQTFAVDISALPLWTAAPINLVDGSNLIEVVARDSATLTTTVFRTIILDPAAPAVTITGPTGGDTYASSVNSVVLSGVASDNRTVDSVKWSRLTAPVLMDQDIPLSGPPGSVTWMTSGIALSPGSNTIRVRATDEAGLFTDDVITVTYDTNSPGITITSPTPAPETTTLAASVSLGGNANDDFQLQSVTWINAATGLSGPATPPLAGWTTPLIALNPGANVITVIAIDAAGNTQTDSITVYQDQTPPAITITSPTSDDALSTAVDSISLGGTASDDVRVVQVSWTRTGLALPNSGVASGTTAWSIASIPLDIGPNTITVTVTDGIQPPQNDTIDVFYDPTAPTISITTPTPDPMDPPKTTTTPVSLLGTAGDNVAVTEVAWANLTTGGSGIASGTTDWSCLVPLTSGGNIIVLTSKDAAGNTGTDTIEIIYDPAAPIIAITSPTTAISIATNVTPIVISGTASDDVGVDSVDWTTSGGVLVTGGQAAGTDSWSFSVQLAPGENIITVVATDGVLRTGTTFLTVVYDPTPPQVTVLVPTTEANYKTTQDTINVSGVANDNLSLQSVTWSNLATGEGGPTQGVGAWTISSATLLEGPNLFTVTATDGVNNVGTKQLTVSYDGTNPLIDIVTPDNSATFDTSTRPLTIIGTASDLLGLASVTWVNDRGGSGTATLGVPAVGQWTASVPNLVTGLNQITFTATDDHGRTATDVITINFTPEANLPNIIIVTPVAGPAISQVVAFTGTADDDPGVVAVTWRNRTTGIRGTAVIAVPGVDPVDWSASVPLAAGPNILEATAFDDAGNTATATVTVTYTPPATDTTDPFVTVTSPTTEDLYTATVSRMALLVDATDDDGVAGVYWTNEGTGGIGTLTPGVDPEWSANIALALGTNVITVTVVDASGNTFTDTLIVTFTPAGQDGSPPDLDIVSPPPATTYSTSVGTVTLTGTSLDATDVAEVVWSNPATETTGSAEGTLAWTADVGLEPGINIITVRAYDVFGNTTTASITVLYTPPPPPPEVVPAGSCGLVGLDAVALLLGLAAWRRRRSRK